MLLRKSSDRGHANHGWLDSFHTFSFSSYYDPAHMGFRTLRVINEDRVAPGGGFPTHPHRDMEIVTYVLEGGLEHRDSMGNGSVMRPCDVQRMSAGTGVTHSEFNASAETPVHFLQIWIAPDKAGHAPSYEQTHFDPGEKRGCLRLVASPDGREGSVTIHQDARILAGLFDGAETATYALAPGRAAWVHVVRGTVTVGDGGTAAGAVLEAGDAAAIAEGGLVTLAHGKDAEVLLFDLV
jgi:redox-sensitive bicupin YhaK (pirin superfamily)